MSFDINVLVNGSRCKIYNHREKYFVEAKKGSEYVVEIKNNSWDKILAVVSVDGLNVIDGEPAEDNGTGYILNKYSSQKLYGFQYSKEKVATFKFGDLGAVKIDTATGKPEIDPTTGKEIPLGYAASKGNGAEKNAGVIGIRIWNEIPQPPPPEPPPQPRLSVSCSWSIHSISNSFAVSSSYCANNLAIHYGTASYSLDPHTWLAGQVQHLTTTNANSQTYNTALSNPKFDLSNMVEDHCIPVRSTSLIGDVDMASNVASFDMETQWGEAKPYKVKEAAFQRRDIVHSLDIYYASRESLIAMGVDLGTEKQVSFPESFRESKYAKPPKGWSA